MSPLALPLRFLQTQSDAQLAKLAGEGHERAFEALVRRYRKPLLAYCRRMTSSEASAEDALQQGLLQAWTAIRTGSEVRDPRAWLYRIVHNVAISSQRRPRPIPVEIEDTVCANGADHEAERRMAVREALEGLAALPEMQRDVLVSTAVDGLSHEEVAHALGLSSGAVRGLVYRARATLRAAAAAVLPGPLIGWSLRSAERGGSPGLTEALAGGGSAGLGALLVKGGAIAVTAGALATAGIAADEDHHRAHPAGAGAGIAAQRQSGSRTGAPTLAHDRLVADSTGRMPGASNGGSGNSDDRGGAAEPGDDSGGHGGRGSGRDHASEHGGGTRGGRGSSSGRDDGGAQSGRGGSRTSGGSGASSGSGRSGEDSSGPGGSSGVRRLQRRPGRLPGLEWFQRIERFPRIQRLRQLERIRGRPRTERQRLQPRRFRDRLEWPRIRWERLVARRDGQRLRRKFGLRRRRAHHFHHAHGSGQQRQLTRRPAGQHDDDGFDVGQWRPRRRRLQRRGRVERRRLRTRSQLARPLATADRERQTACITSHSSAPAATVGRSPRGT